MKATFMVDATKVLRDLLTAEQTSTVALAKRLGVDQASIWRIVHDRQVPSPALLERLLDELGYRIEVNVTPR